MGQTTGRLTLGLGLLTTLAACSATPTDSISGAPAVKRGGVYLGASGYSVAQPDSAMRDEVATDSAQRGVYLGAGGY
jgi:hypothetical protein